MLAKAAPLSTPTLAEEEVGRYLGELPFEQGKLRLPGGLIESAKP